MRKPETVDTNATSLAGGENRLNRAIIVVLGFALLASVLAILYIALVPAHGEPFTEFYLIGPDGKAGDYPRKLYTGEPVSVIVGIVNHEYRDVACDLVVTLGDGANTSRLYQESMTLASGQTLEKPIALIPDRVGTQQKLEFLLYIDGNYTAPYRDLHLWVDVRSPQ